MYSWIRNNPGSCNFLPEVLRIRRFNTPVTYRYRCLDRYLAIIVPSIPFSYVVHRCLYIIQPCTVNLANYTNCGPQI